MQDLVLMDLRKLYIICREDFFCEILQSVEDLDRNLPF